MRGEAHKAEQILEAQAEERDQENAVEDERHATAVNQRVNEYKQQFKLM